MNFLAHLYLSNNVSQRQIGNFIADAIKGNKYTHLPLEVQKGILHHRAIDTFTDTHPIVKKSKRRLHNRYGHYKGVIIDIIYDHFLAKNWNNYSATPLDVYVDAVYNLLNSEFETLPEKTQYMLPFMIEYNWLYNYQFIEGIQQVLNGMNNRTKKRSQMNLAVEDLEKHYQDFEQDFTIFFKDLESFYKGKIRELEI